MMTAIITNMGSNPFALKPLPARRRGELERAPKMPLWLKVLIGIKVVAGVVMATALVLGL